MTETLTPKPPGAIKEYENHPLANLFPMMGDEELKVLIEDHRKNGQRNPITTYEGKILDGRNRFRACRVARIEPRFEPLPVGVDPLAFVMSANLHRRHLNESQRALIAARLASADIGGDRKGQSANLRTEITQENAAKLLNVSTRSVTDAVKILPKPELVVKVEQGKMKVSAAAKSLEEKLNSKTPAQKATALSKDLAAAVATLDKDDAKPVIDNAIRELRVLATAKGIDV